MGRFEAVAGEFAGLGVKLYAVSADSPFANEAWAKQLGIEQEILSDWNHEAARAFGILKDEVFGFKPMNTRGAFLVDTEGVVRYSWAPQERELPEAKPVLEAAHELVGR
jgi:peroxiredoxin